MGSFPHDFGARNSARLAPLQMSMGGQGLAVYWCIVEMLWESGGVLRCTPTEVAYQLRWATAEEVERVLSGFGLFSSDGCGYWSEEILSDIRAAEQERAQAQREEEAERRRREAKSRQARKAIKARWAKNQKKCADEKTYGRIYGRNTHVYNSQSDSNLQDTENSYARIYGRIYGRNTHVYNSKSDNNLQGSPDFRHLADGPENAEKTPDFESPNHTTSFIHPNLISNKEKNKEKEIYKERENNKENFCEILDEPPPRRQPAISRFVKPSLDEVRRYMGEMGYTFDAEHFYDHYTSNGWKVGRNAMSDWKAAVRNWNREHQNRKSDEHKEIDTRLHVEVFPDGWDDSTI